MKRTSLFAINSFELMIIHGVVWIVCFICLFILKFYLKNDKSKLEILKKLLGHTITVHVFILTVSEFGLAVVMQLLNINKKEYMTGLEKLSITFTIIACIYFLMFYIYFFKRFYNKK